jgi:hypothetical protein
MRQVKRTPDATSMLLNILQTFSDAISWKGEPEWLSEFLPEVLITIIFCAICYPIGKLGVQIRSGITILKYIYQANSDAKAKGFSMNEKGLALKRKGQLKLFIPLLIICISYLLIFAFVLEWKNRLAYLFILIPVGMGYFGYFFVPEGSEDLFEEHNKQ